MVVLLVLAGCAWVSNDDLCLKVGDCTGGGGPGSVDTADTDEPADDTADTDDPGDDTGGGSDDTATGDDTGGCDPVTWYRDGDGDGWGVDTDTEEECEAPSGYVADPGDCDDASAAFHPTAPDACDDGVDHDCSGGDDTCTFDGEQDVETAAGATLTGDPGDLLGTTVGVAGDLDGDGDQELIVGSGSTNAVWGVPGSLGLSTAGSVSAADVGAVRAAGDADLQLGQRVVPVGGTNPGVLLAAGGDMGGAVSTSGWLFLDSMPATGALDTDAAGRLYVDTASTAVQGWSGVAGAFDFDGEAELLLGARTTTSGLEVGRVWLWDGAVSGAAGLDADAGSIFTLAGGESGREFGAAVELCDVDGDGREDPFIGAPGGNETDFDGGSAFGWQAANVAGAMVADDADWILQIPVESVRERVGYQLGCGDLDGDGTSDLLVGAEASQKEQVQILPGGATTFAAAGGVIDMRYPAVISDLGDPDFYLMDMHFAVMPDVDADGRDELVMAWPGLEDDLDSNDGAGRVYVLSGPFTGNTSVVDSSKAVFRGDVPQRGLGTTLAVGDDLDGDLVLGNAGVPGADGSRGSVFLLLGGSR